MCGIFGFALRKPVSMIRVFRVLEKLEVHQYPQEPNPVGGYGAGVAILEDDGSLVVEKVGKVGDSPVKFLSGIVKADKASVLIGHVRMPSPELMATAKSKETAQPYVVEREPNLTVASVHNGKVENYKELRTELGESHVFESEKIQLVDSEVIPHVFEELLSEKQDNDQALYALFCALNGSSAIAILQVGEENSFLNLIHKGKTRGLTIWANQRNELVFCTRKVPLVEKFDSILAKGEFREKISIGYHEDAGLKLSYQLPSRLKG